MVSSMSAQRSGAGMSKLIKWVDSSEDLNGQTILSVFTSFSDPGKVLESSWDDSLIRAELSHKDHSLDQARILLLPKMVSPRWAIVKMVFDTQGTSSDCFEEQSGKLSKESKKTARHASHASHAASKALGGSDMENKACLIGCFE